MTEKCKVCGKELPTDTEYTYALPFYEGQIDPRGMNFAVCAFCYHKAHQRKKLK